jgi:hypothetical protein
MALIVTVAYNPGAADGYVPPSQQIVRFMTENFLPIRSLKVVQTVEVGFPDERSHLMVEEKMWLKAPAFYAADRKRFQISSESPGQGSTQLLPRGRLSVQPAPHREKQTQPPVVFRRLLMANGGDVMMDVLMQLGVDTGYSGLDRIDGRVAYRIGMPKPESPRLLIEKKTFLPLLLRYEIADEWGQTVWTIRFGDYRRCGEGWYPYEITCSSSNGTIEIYRITSLQVNVPIRRPLSEITVLPPSQHKRIP